MAHYSNHPNLPSIRPGDTFFEIDPSHNIKTNFYVFDNPVGEVLPSGPETVIIDMQVIQHHSEIYKYMSIDASIENRFAFGKIESSMNYEKLFTRNDTSLTYLFYGKKINRGMKIPGTPKLSNEAIDLLKKLENQERLYDYMSTAGTELVTEIKTGSLVSIIYSFNFTDQHAKERFKASLGAEWDSGRGNFDLEKIATDTKVHFELNVEILQKGAIHNDPLKQSHLSGLIALEPGNLDALRQTISIILDDIVRSTNVHQEVLVEFFTMELRGFPEINGRPKAGRYFGEYFRAKGQYQDELNRLAELLKMNYKLHRIVEDSLDNLNANIFKPGAQDYLLSLKAVYEQNITKAKLLFLKTVQQATYSGISHNIKTPPLNFSSIVLKNVYFKSWSHFADKVVCSGEDERARATYTTYFYPIIHIDFPETIDRIEVFDGASVVATLDSGQVKAIAANMGSLKGHWSSRQTIKGFYVWDCDKGDLRRRYAERILPDHKYLEGLKQHRLKVISKSGEYNWFLNTTRE